MKAIEQYCPVFLSIMLYNVVLYFEPVDKILKCDQIKATEQYFSVAMRIMLYKVVLTFESVDQILKCGHSNEKLLSIKFLWCCLFCCESPFLLFSLWMKS